MTKLDLYQPEGERIHPYDAFALLVAPNACCKVVRHCPQPDGQDDYRRNLPKIGSEVLINEASYFITCSTPYKSPDVFFWKKEPK